MIAFELSVLGLTFLNIFPLNWSTYLTNSSLSISSPIDYNYYNSFSSSTGLTNVWQSLSLKKCLMRRLIRFFYSMLSLEPFYCWRACSKYCLEVMAVPVVSRRRREKSRTTHRKEGKYFAISSGSHSPNTSVFICSSFERFIYIEWYKHEMNILTISDRLLIAFSSIVPILLYMKYEHSSKAIKNIFVSWLSSSSNAPIPSLSMRRIFNFSP